MVGYSKTELYVRNTAFPIEYCSMSFRPTIRDPVKGIVIADSDITMAPTAFIFTVTRYCLFSMFYRYNINDKKFVGKMYIEGALMSRSRNIALRCGFVSITS